MNTYGDDRYTLQNELGRERNLKKKRRYFLNVVYFCQALVTYTNKGG